MGSQHYEDAGQPATDAGVLTVGELTTRIKSLLGGFGRVAVEGEVSGLKRPASGHLYFDLKGKSGGVEAVVHCAIWRSQTGRAMREPLEEGAKVVAHGRLDVYAPRGNYSLIVDRIEGRGMGALLEELERLKAKLAADGWFDRARPLPRLPRTIGVVTSRDGAAFQDVLRTRTLRWPLYPLRIAHTPVQGPGAAGEIARAIARLDASGVDLILVCRGGGSLEDLWAFNELGVAEAVRACSVPVVSGVGHETDLTLCDLVADWRAHTPTDAAQHVIPDRGRLHEVLERHGQYLLDAVDRQLERRERELARLGKARVLRHPGWIMQDRQASCARLAARLVRTGAETVRHAGERLELASTRLTGHAPRARLERDSARLAALGRRLIEPPRARLEALEARLALAARSLGAISPFAVLERGYSLSETLAGEVVHDARQLQVGDQLRTRFASGSATSRVEAVEETGAPNSGDANEEGR